MEKKYTPNDSSYAIHTYTNGFCFGGCILAINGAQLNAENQGWCDTGSDNYYDVEGEDMSQLTRQKDKFTCTDLEVYKVLFT